MTNMTPKTTTRSIPRSLAKIVEILELRQPKLVTKGLLAEIVAKEKLDLPVDEVAHRLQKEGWLLSLRRRGTWEFAPAARAGPLDSGDPFIELRAVLTHRPNYQVAVAYESAAWLHSLANRPPQRHVIAVPPDLEPLKTLKAFRITRNWGQLDREWREGLPLWTVETLLVLMAVRPTAYNDWPNVSEWLTDAVSSIDDRLVFKELEGRNMHTWVRMGYLLEYAGRLDLGEEIHLKVSHLQSRPIYFGPRKRPSVFNSRWDVVDSILDR